MKLADLAGTTIRFSGQLQRPKTGEGTILPLPVITRLSTQGSTMVEGTIQGFPFRAPFEPGEGLRISETLQKASGAKEGASVAVEITRVGDEPEVMAPADLLEALALAPPAQKLWPEITPMARREWVRWIASAKQEETRARRIEVGIDKLSKGMRRPCCFPGLNWVTKDLVSPDETWAPLPSAKGRHSSG